MSFQVYGTSEQNKKIKKIKVAYGKVKDIKFPLIPYGNLEVKKFLINKKVHHIIIILDNKYNFAEINPLMADITSKNFCGYLGS